MNADSSQVLPANPSAAATVILASASATRARLLSAAGVSFHALPAYLDEAEIKRSMRADGAAAGDVARGLAELKALSLSRRLPGSFVIGADQMLSCNDVWFDKPPDLDHARAQLVALRGRSHTLHSAACVVRDGIVTWHVVAEATLTMRPFSDTFLDSYLAGVGAAVLQSVGAYQLEGLGAQLFSRIDGDWFTILGLPLLPLLGFLREHRLLPS